MWDDDLEEDWTATGRECRWCGRELPKHVGRGRPRVACAAPHRDESTDVLVDCRRAYRTARRAELRIAKGEQRKAVVWCRQCIGEHPVGEHMNK